MSSMHLADFLIFVIGVWPESRSFSDKGLGPVPAKYKGICQNEHDSTFHCNRYVRFSTTLFFSFQM